MPSRRGRLAAVMACVTASLGLLPVSATPAAAQPLRDIVLIGNAQAGTVSFLDGRTFANLGSFNAIPDLEERLAAMNPVERIGYEFVNQLQGYKKFVDDVAMSPDGRTLYVSRGNLADVVAYDLAGRRLLWRFKVEGFKADHAAISPDGSRFVVSALTAQKAHVLDTRTGALLTSFATGTYPHGNDYSPDGTRVYNSSIGTTSLPKAMNGLKGDRQLTMAGATDFRVQRTYQFEYGIRPAVFMPDNRTMYAQLSYLNGIVEYDLDAGRITKTVQLPLSEKAARMSTEDYPQNSAHHGLAHSGDKLCAAGTIDDYTVILNRADLMARGYQHYPTDSLPYWTTTSLDGRHCLVSLSNKNTISVVDYATAKEVASVAVGHFPQRERLGRVVPAALAGLNPTAG